MPEKYIVEENIGPYDPMFEHGRYETKAEAVSAIQKIVDTQDVNPDDLRIIVEITFKVKKNGKHTGQ